MTHFKEIPANKKSMLGRKLVHGFGINDADYITKLIINGKEERCPFYKTWKHMIGRCYSNIVHITQPTYIGCSVVEEWRLFSGFKAWMKDQDWKDKALDKDILRLGNKVYSPEYCVFVSQAVNNLLNSCSAGRGKYPRGVSLRKNRSKFLAECQIEGKSKGLGLFSTPELASDAYIAAKHDEIIRVADTQPENIRHGLYRHADKLKARNN
jgi:hypothetical protein